MLMSLQLCVEWHVILEWIIAAPDCTNNTPPNVCLLKTIEMKSFLMEKRTQLSFVINTMAVDCVVMEVARASVAMVLT